MSGTNGETSGAEVGDEVVGVVDAIGLLACRGHKHSPTLGRTVCDACGRFIPDAELSDISDENLTALIKSVGAAKADAVAFVEKRVAELTELHKHAAAVAAKAGRARSDAYYTLTAFQNALRALKGGGS